MIIDCYFPYEIMKALFVSEHLSLMCSSVLAMVIDTPSVTLQFYIFIFLLTCASEAPIYFYAGRKRTHSILSLLGQFFLLNLATHPIVFWVIPYLLKLVDGSILSFVVIGESFAILIEALILKFKYKYSWGLAFSTSTAANLFSWSLGLWLQRQNLI